MAETASMAKVLVVTSGKGGVGKTTSTAALGAALAQAGQKVAVVDFDVGLRNLDLVMGAERRVVFDFINVVQGVAKLSQALIRDKRLETLWLLPASQTRDKDALTEEGVASIINELRGQFDWVICDSPAGIERGATLAMRFADTAVIVTNPEVSSVRDSDRIIGLLDSKTEKAENGQLVDKHTQRSQRPARQAVRTESGMNVLTFFRRRGSAPVAKERLQILLSYERAARGQSDLLAVLREDILAALTKHITVERENVQVRMDRGENVSTLEIEVEIPNSAVMLLATGS